MGGGDFKKDKILLVHLRWKYFFFSPDGSHFFSIQWVKVSYGPYVSYVTSILNNNKNLIRQSDS